MGVPSGGGIASRTCGTATTVISIAHEAQTSGQLLRGETPPKADGAGYHQGPQQVRAPRPDGVMRLTRLVAVGQPKSEAPADGSAVAPGCPIRALCHQHRGMSRSSFQTSLVTA